MNRRSIIAIISGVIILAATFATFKLIDPEIYTSTKIGLGFLMYAEAVLFGGFALADTFGENASKPLVWSGIGIPVSLYAGIVFISSLIYMLVKTESTKGFLVLQVILFAAVLVICLIVGNISVSVKEKDSQVLRAVASLTYILDQLRLIREQVDEKAKIDKLIDDLRYSDVSVSVDADVELDGAVSVLQGIVGKGICSGDDFEKAVQSVEFLIKKRNFQARASKQGGI